MKKRKYLIIGIFLVLGVLIFNKTLSELKPIPKVDYKSQNLDYDKKEPGSFIVENSAKWIGDGKAKITLEVKSVMKESTNSKDIVFVLDVSGSMDGDKIAKVKKDVKEMAKAVLSNPKNRVALISFESGAKKLSNFTSDIDEFIKMVDNLNAGGGTNYKAGLEEVDKILEGYKKENDRDIKTLFLTDGYPCVDTPNEVAVYKRLKQKYPYMDINAIQYEMGEDIKEEIKVISDKQYHADMKDLNNVLFEAGTSALTYDNFIIKDFLSKHFKGDASTIKVNQGKTKLEGDQLIWDLGSYKTGKEAKLEIEVDLTGPKEEFYKVNKGIEIKTSLENKKDDQLSSKTPILKGAYKVIYESNAPKGCTVKGLEKTTSHRPFEKIALVKGQAKCDGYLFQGYELITDAKYINQDYIEMPESDVIFRATWTKAKVDKGMQGKVAKVTLYNQIKHQSLGNDKEKGIDYSKVNSSTNGEGVYLFDETKNDIKPVYFFRGTHQLKNNLLYANLCWKIVRTTETGGVRVVYNGAPVNGKCTNTTGNNTQIGTSNFNRSSYEKQYVGYMYGDGTNPYQNNNDSDIKKYIDNWYKSNIKDKGFELSLDKGSIYCGDRTEGTIRGDYHYYAGNDRIEAGKPTIQCSNNDSYSVEAGNRKLTYPVALLSVDDVMLAGGQEKNSIDNYYLYTNRWYWLLSPTFWYNGGNMNVYSVNYSGFLAQWYVSDTRGVRPALTIDTSAPLLSGDGSQTNPYII